MGKYKQIGSELNSRNLTNIDGILQQFMYINEQSIKNIYHLIKMKNFNQCHNTWVKTLLYRNKRITKQAIRIM